MKPFTDQSEVSTFPAEYKGPVWTDPKRPGDVGLEDRWFHVRDLSLLMST